MKVMINGIVYDSLETPILLVFDNEWEKRVFNMDRFVSTPYETTIEERQVLLDKGIDI